MASAHAPPSSDLSYDEALQMVERWTTAGPSNEEKANFLKEAIQSLSQSGVLQMTEQALRDLANRTVQTTVAFAKSYLSLGAFARQYGLFYPGIIQYRNDWNTLTSSWSVNLQKSKSYATQCAADYGVYTTILQRYNMDMTREQILQAATEFKDLGRKLPVDIPADFQNTFLDLSRDMSNFRTRLIAYLQQQTSLLAGSDAAIETAAIETLQREITESTGQIQNLLSHLSAPSWLGLVGIPVPGPLEVLLAKRIGQKVELRKEVAAAPVGGSITEDARTMMLRLIAEFIILAMNFDDLVEFAQIWNGFHHDAVDFGTKFESLETPTNLPQIYRDRIILALEVSVPLVRGLNAYASIVN